MASMTSYKIGANEPRYEINTLDANTARAFCATKRQAQARSQPISQGYGVGIYRNTGIKVIAGTNNRNLTRNKVCPSCFMSTITVSPDEWAQCLESLEIMISSIINGITTQES